MSHEQIGTPDHEAEPVPLREQRKPLNIVISHDALPIRVQKLPTTVSGLPIPAIIEPDAFLGYLMDRVSKTLVQRAFDLSICGVCGRGFGVPAMQTSKRRAFLLPDMTAVIARLSTLPPMHVSCARWLMRSQWMESAPICTLEQHETWLEHGPKNTGHVQALELDEHPFSIEFWSYGCIVTNKEVMLERLKMGWDALLEIVEDVNQHGELNVQCGVVQELLIPCALEEAAGKR